jgi:hypothetical protein
MMRTKHANIEPQRIQTRYNLLRIKKSAGLLKKQYAMAKNEPIHLIASIDVQWVR